MLNDRRHRPRRGICICCSPPPATAVGRGYSGGKPKEARSRSAASLHRWRGEEPPRFCLPGQRRRHGSLGSTSPRTAERHQGRNIHNSNPPSTSHQRPRA